MTNTKIFYTYPWRKRSVRRVDSVYAYLVTREGFVPLRRREGCLSAIWRYDVYAKIICLFTGDHLVDEKRNVVFENINDLSDFFQTQMLREEYGEKKVECAAL